MSLFKEALLDEADARAAGPAPPHIALIVDDEVGNLRVLRAMLSDRFRVLEACDGAEALEVLASLPAEDVPALILSDQRMPRMTGVQLFEQLRESMPDTIRIIITGFVDVGAIVDSINRAGIYKFVVKPFSHHELSLTVDRAMEVWRERRQMRDRLQQLESAFGDRVQLHAALGLDPLTGLDTRQSMAAALTSLPDAGAASHGALLLVDIDHLREINSSHGHAAGDALLRGVTGALRAYGGSALRIARWGEEEFLLHLQVDNEQEAMICATQIRAAIQAAHFDLGDGQTLSCTCSVGVAIWPSTSSSWAQVLHLAEERLRTARRQGDSSSQAAAAPA